MDTIKFLLAIIVVGGLVIYIFNQAPEIFKKLNVSNPFRFEPFWNSGKMPTGAVPPQTFGPKIKISSVFLQPLSAIKLVSNASEEINLTAWRIKSEKGEMEILKGVEIYNPAGSVMGDIKLKSGQMLTIYSTTNPLGINLRLNKCLTGVNLENFNLPSDYRNCFILHSRDNDFLLNEWVIWAGRDIIGSSPGKVSLYDKNGNLIDEYIY